MHLPLHSSELIQAKLPWNFHIPWGISTPVYYKVPWGHTRLPFKWHFNQPFARLTHMTNRHRQAISAATSHLMLCIAMRPNNNKYLGFKLMSLRIKISSKTSRNTVRKINYLENSLQIPKISPQWWRNKISTPDSATSGGPTATLTTEFDYQHGVSY